MDSDQGALLARGIEHHQAGRLAPAEDCYRGVLTKDPRHADANNLLGLIAHQTGHISVAVVLAMAGGECSFVRVALGACGPTPVRAAEAEARLRGTALDAVAVSAAAAILVEESDPIDDVRGSAEYRLMLVPRLLARALAAARAKAEDAS